MENFQDSTSLQDAKRWLRSRMDEGAYCPCCDQLAKVYRRKLNSGMAKCLIKLYQISEDDEEFHSIVELRRLYSAFNISSGDECKLQYWGLIEEKQETTVRDVKNSGYWRITEKGRKFVEKKLSVRSHVKVYDGELLGFDGDLVFIDKCLTERFKYSELMNDH